MDDMSRDIAIMLRLEAEETREQDSATMLARGDCIICGAHGIGHGPHDAFCIDCNPDD